MGFYPIFPLPVTGALITPPINLSGSGTAELFGANTTGDTNERVTLGADGFIRFGSGSGATDALIQRIGVNTLGTGGTVTMNNLDCTQVGGGLKVAEGANGKQGTFILTGGTTQTIANTAVTANSRIFLTAQVTGGTPGIIGVASRIAATSFTVFCVATDTSTYAFEIFEPG